MDSYEIGFKTSYLDGAGNFDLTAFMYDYTDAQVIQYVDVGDTFSAKVLNAGKTDGMGVEASTTVAISEYTTLYLSIGYLNTDVTGLGDPDLDDGVN